MGSTASPARAKAQKKSTGTPSRKRAPQRCRRCPGNPLRAQCEHGYRRKKDTVRVFLFHCIYVDPPLIQAILIGRLKSMLIYPRSCCRHLWSLLCSFRKDPSLRPSYRESVSPWTPFWHCREESLLPLLQTHRLLRRSHRLLHRNFRRLILLRLLKKGKETLKVTTNGTRTLAPRVPAPRTRRKNASTRRSANQSLA
jgi:hypothetical protein